jgi:hypothetical protein
MLMKPANLFKAILYPLTESSVIIPVLVFWLLMSFARWGGVLGLYLMFLVIPAVFRYQMILLEARAYGREPATPDVDFFRWFGNAWTLFPVPLVLIAAWGITAAGASFGSAAAILALFVAGALLPASFAVLAITHSPMQSLNPVAIGRLLQKCADTFWIASVYMVVAGWIMLQAESLPTMLANLVTMLLISSVFSVIGSLIEPYGLMEDVSIPDSLQPDEEAIAGDLEKARTDVLTHAYGFVSRGNREGGFKHIMDCITKDPDVVAAWAWFFDRMMAWEQNEHALFFAQHYIHDMLQHGEKTPALKVIIRCRLVNEQFRPLREDMPAAIEAAESSGNIELATVLKRS